MNLRSPVFRNRLRQGSLICAALLCFTPASASETISYTYDTSGHLVQVSRTNGVNNGIKSCFAFDSADNRTMSAVATAGCPIGFSIDSVSATEGGSLVFTVTKSGTATTAVTVNYACASETATINTDFTCASGQLSFQTTDTSKTITVATTQDTTVESNETFKVTLSSPSGGAVLADPQGIGTIIDND